MAELMSKEDFLDLFYVMAMGQDKRFIEAVEQVVNDTPTINEHGHWIKPTVIDGRAFNIPHCSVCNEVPCGVDEHTKYCPNCGTKMDEVSE